MTRSASAKRGNTVFRLQIYFKVNLQNGGVWKVAGQEVVHDAGGRRIHMCCALIKAHHPWLSQKHAAKAQQLLFACIDRRACGIITKQSFPQHVTDHRLTCYAHSQVQWPQPGLMESNISGDLLSR